MVWYYYLPLGPALFLAAILAAMFLPLRIFISYLRENKIERAVLTVKIYLIGIKLIYLREAAPEIRALLKLGSRPGRGIDGSGNKPSPLGKRTAPAAAAGQHHQDHDRYPNFGIRQRRRSGQSE